MHTGLVDLRLLAMSIPHFLFLAAHPDALFPRHHSLKVPLSTGSIPHSVIRALPGCPALELLLGLAIATTVRVHVNSRFAIVRPSAKPLQKQLIMR